MKRRFDTNISEFKKLQEKKRNILEIEKDKIHTFVNNNNDQGYRWIDLPIIDEDDNIFATDIQLRLFILQNLKDAFKPDFPDKILLHFLYLEASDEKLNINYSSKISTWYNLFNNESFKIRESTMNQLWNIVLQEQTATESALLFSINSAASKRKYYDSFFSYNSNEEEKKRIKDKYENQTFENNSRDSWEEDHNYGLVYRDYNHILADEREKQIKSILDYINKSCNIIHKYEFTNLLDAINGSIYYTYQTVLNEDVSYQNNRQSYSNITAIILLNNDYGYLGHVYLFSPPNFFDNSISNLRLYPQLYMQGIRTSLINYLLGKYSSPLARHKISWYILQGAQDYARRKGYKSIRAWGPIGDMSTILNKYGWIREPMNTDMILPIS